MPCLRGRRWAPSCMAQGEGVIPSQHGLSCGWAALGRGAAGSAWLGCLSSWPGAGSGVRRWQRAAPWHGAGLPCGTVLSFCSPEQLCLEAANPLLNIAPSAPSACSSPYSWHGGRMLLLSGGLAFVQGMCWWKEGILPLRSGETQPGVLRPALELEETPAMI